MAKHKPKLSALNNIKSIDVNKSLSIASINDINNIPKDKLSYVKLSQINLYELNPRIDITNNVKENKDFLRSIKNEGIITPIILIRDSNSPNSFTVIEGNRRITAARIVFKEDDPLIPALILSDKDKVDVLKLIFQGNYHRENLSNEELALNINRLQDAQEATGKERFKSHELAEFFNVSSSLIRKIISVNNIEDEHKSKLDEVGASFASKIEFATADNEVKQKILKDKITKRDEIVTIKKQHKEQIKTKPEIVNGDVPITINYKLIDKDKQYKIHIVSNSDLSIQDILRDSISKADKFNKS